MVTPEILYVGLTFEYSLTCVYCMYLWFSDATSKSATISWSTISTFYSPDHFYYSQSRCCWRRDVAIPIRANVLECNVAQRVCKWLFSQVEATTMHDKSVLGIQKNKFGWIADVAVISPTSALFSSNNKVFYTMHKNNIGW